jgi:hypothetical protein
MIRALSRLVAAAATVAIYLLAQDEVGMVVGAAVDPGGAPAASARIELTRAGFGEIYRGTADSSGRFEIKDLPPGEYRISVSSPFAYRIIERFYVTAITADLGLIHLVLARCNTPGGAICDELQPLKSAVTDKQASANIPILTVCEILADVSRYDGSPVIIVGRFSGGMEGSWLDEQCSPQIAVNGRLWPPSISTTYVASEFAPPPHLPRGFKWDRSGVRSKLEQVQRTTRLRPGKNNSESWLAMFGRLEAALPRRIIQRDGRQFYADGFGHLSAAPAQLVVPEDGTLRLK